MSSLCYNGSEGTEMINLDISLGEIENLLDSGTFMRTHRQYIVNLTKIEPYEKTPPKEIELDNGHRVPLSRRKRTTFHNIYSKFRSISYLGNR